MIGEAPAAALHRIAQRADDLRHAFDPGFEPVDGTVPRAASHVPALDPLSAAAAEGWYFASETSAGLRFGRDGGFSFADGTLRTRDGAPVLGFVAPDAAPRALRADPVDAALGRIADARIAPDGTLSYARTLLEPRSGVARSERVLVGRVALARFPAGTHAPRADATHVEAPPGVAPVYARPGAGDAPQLATFARDLGAVDPYAGARRLQESYLAFDALQAAVERGFAFDRVAADLVK